MLAQALSSRASEINRNEHRAFFIEYDSSSAGRKTGQQSLKVYRTAGAISCRRGVIV
jgi:hypothetical protein